MILQKATYRRISLAFLMLFVSFLVSPSLLVTLVDQDADISFVFALVEEETKESKEKNVLDTDEPFDNSVNPYFKTDEIKISVAQLSFIKILSSLYSPGEVAPPPEFS